jgi:hypothetical protein
MSPYSLKFSGDIKGLPMLDVSVFPALALVFTAFFLYSRFASQTASSGAFGRMPGRGPVNGRPFSAAITL